MNNLKRVGFSILALLMILLLGNVIFEKIYPLPSQVIYGVTFSPKYARYLNLDWQKTYIQILDELEVRYLRIPGYWEILEPKSGKYNFSETDFMLYEADKRNARVILVLGMKQPRWPECQVPIWAKDLSVSERRQKILSFIQKVVDRYKDNQAIWAWQVENEPFLPFFGEGCDRADVNFLRTEVNLVRSLSDKKIIVTDSGELGTWLVPMQLSDIFGSTLYRDVYNPLLGYLSYPVLPYFYNIHSQLVRKLFAPLNKETMIIELQAEPWLSNGDLSRNYSEQARLFPLLKMQSYINYAKKTGFAKMYLWGVEWWYFMAENGYPQYLDYAKTLFK